MDDNSMREQTLPGFRFHPTEEELIDFYLKRTALGLNLRSDVIGFLNIYLYDPWELPGMAKIGEREWYFFVHRDRRNGHGGRPNRTTKYGFWKATGSDRKIRSLSEPKNVLGLKKTLVFYKGRAPRGTKTDWVMNEYRLPDNQPSPKEDVVLCKIYRKATSLKILEQRATMEDAINEKTVGPVLSSPVFSSPQWQEIPEENSGESLCQNKDVTSLPKTKEEYNDLVVPSSNVQFGCLKHNGDLMGLEVPKFNMDITTESLWAQLRSPWLDNWSPGTFANLLNY
ncbi:hypothetical protein ACH5RR_011932 [Cinchona calisaya]|uniref:NAC domain-containing protein n=1 Tax=Cinchona calisaya TaxID=153742 RepID=A0ABD3A8U1_9GENT